jgi:squalene-associated FAD-dependent desaturase
LPALGPPHWQLRWLAVSLGASLHFPRHGRRAAMSGRKVVVVGGGLAGITAAIELAAVGLPVCLVEARPWLGGATCSFARRGLVIDNGQHAFFRHWTAYRGLLASLGVTDLAQITGPLDVTVVATPGRARLRRSALPAPLHLAGSLARYRLLSPAERFMAASAVAALGPAGRFGGDGNEAGFAEWLTRHRQSEHARRMLWDALCVPALNVETDTADAALARGMLSGLLTGKDSADIGVPTVPLSQLHAAPAATLLGRLGAQVRLSRTVGAIHRDGSAGYEIRLEAAQDTPQEDQLPFEPAEPELISAAAVVLAVPAWEAVRLVPGELAGDAAGWAKLEASPIVSLHVVYGSRVTELPFAVVADLPARWIVDKTSAAGLHAGQYLAVSIPAADRYVDTPGSALREEFLPILHKLFPAAATARVEDFFVTRERRATVRQRSGAGCLRPAQATRLPGLVLAGAWTDTGVPDCMEGAVRSGLLAARTVLHHLSGGGWADARTTSGSDSVASARPARLSRTG